MIGEIKKRGSEAYRKNYWSSVFAALLMTSGVTIGVSLNLNRGKVVLPEVVQKVPSVQEMPTELIAVILGLLASVVVTALLFAVIYNVFIGNPFRIGGKIFFLKNSNDPGTNVKEVMAGFDKGWYLNNVKTMFICRVILFLAGLLFVFPGIILSYCYMLVPYLITEDPSLEGTAALKKSRQLMRGWKWKAFCLDLSFIGWQILGVITMGILDIFLVNPYKQASEAELYKMIRDLNSPQEAPQTVNAETWPVSEPPAAEAPADYAPAAPVEDVPAEAAPSETSVTVPAEEVSAEVVSVESPVEAVPAEEQPAADTPASEE